MNKRKHERIPLCIDVRVYLSDDQFIVLDSIDISHGGVLLDCSGHTMPPVGAVVRLQVADSTGDGDRPVVSARIIRINGDQVALEFDQD